MAIRDGPGTTGVLVGRTNEQRSIATALQETVAGQPSVIYVEGDPGLGKTALVRDTLRHLPAGIHVKQAHAEELAADVPFELAGRLGSSNTESSFAAGLQLLETWASYQDTGPVLVVVEDLHWADTESSKALLCAAHRLDEDRVTLIVTARPGVRNGWERLNSDSDRCHRINLSLLTSEDVAALAASEDIELSLTQAERLRRHTGGHPLYVRTLLNELSPAELRVVERDLPAPSSLTSAVTAGLSEVQGPARRIAAALAVINQRTALTQIGQVAGVKAPIEPLEELLGTGFVRWDPDEPGSPVEFAHPLYRQAIYQDLSPGSRRDLHRAAAELSSPSVALMHRVAAADGADDELAEELAAAAQLEQDRGAPAIAARNLLWSSSLSSDPGRSQERLLGAAQAYLASRQNFRVVELQDRISACNPSAQRDLLLGIIQWELGHPDEAQRWLAGAADPSQVGSGPSVMARAWAELAEIHLLGGRPQEALNAAEEARALALPATAAERLGWMHGSLAEAFLRGAPAGLEYLRGRLPHPPEMVDPGDADVLVARATLQLYSGHTEAALADLRVVVALSRQGRGPVLIARTHFEMGTALLSTGAWDEALLHVRTGLGIATDEGQLSVQAECHAILGTLLVYRGQWADADLAVSAAVDEASICGDVEANGVALIARAAIGEARQEPARVINLLEVLPGATPMIGRLAFWPTLITALIDDGALDRAEDQIGEFVASAEERHLSFEPRVQGLRARLAAARKQYEVSDRLFKLSLAGYGPNDPYLERALLLHAYGRSLLAQGHRRLATGPLHEARKALNSVGATPFVERVDLDLVLAGVRAAQGNGSVVSTLDLTDREQDVVVLVAKGLTNPEVADELFVSRKAVEYHLSNIFGKLGITSRRQLRGITFSS